MKDTLRGEVLSWRGVGVLLAAIACSVGLMSLDLSISSAQGASQKALKVVPLEREDFRKIKLPKKEFITSFTPQVGHSRHLTSISMSQDGKLLATASGFSDGVVKLWNLQAKRLLHTFDSEDYVSLSPDGKFIAGGNVGGPVRIWTTADFKLVKELASSGPITFANNGAMLVTEALPKDAVKEGTVELWSTADWSVKRLPQGHEASLSAIALSPSGEVVATGSYDESIKLWNVTSGELMATLKQGVRTPSALALSPGLETLAVSYQGEGTEIELWDLKTAKKRQSLKHAKNVTQLAISTDGQLLAAAGVDGTTRVWRIGDGSGKSSDFKVYQGGGQVAFMPDGAHLVHGLQALTLADMSNASATHSFRANATQIYQTVFSADGASIYTTDAIGDVLVWDVKTGKLERTIPLEKVKKGGAPSGELILSPQGRYVALRPFSGNTVKLWDLSQENTAAQSIPFEGMAAIGGVTFAPNEQELVIEGPAANDGTQLVWYDLEKKAQIGATKFSGYVSVDGFVDDGTNVAVTSTGTGHGDAKLSIKLWERDTGLLKSVQVKDVPPFAGDVELSPVGAMVALGDADSSVKLWSRAEEKVVATLPGHTELVNVARFSPDGRMLVTGSWDETVRVWDVEKAKELLALTNTLYQAQHVSFSPNDDVVAISHQGWLRLIHLPTGRTRELYFDVDNSEVGWMVHDGSGRFDCAASGCKMVQYQSNTGAVYGPDDKAVAKLRGVERFGK